jgi:molybdopterin/thiamine biosynthesis adenylyltransferase/rhodanese-related sulfurtransferase
MLVMKVKALAEPMSDLTADQRIRYARQMRLLSDEGQRRLLGGRVLVIGAGGLGSPALLYLAAAGVGTIGIVDDDVVDLTNLHRQVIHGTNSVGVPKVQSAAQRIHDVNPDVTVCEHRVRLDESNAQEIIAGYHVVIDGTDNFLTRYTVDAACSELSIPEVWGSILQYAAQVSVFWTGSRATAHGVAEPGVCLRDLFPTPPPPGSTPSCGEAGVMGALCGQIGSLMANEAIKLLTGIGEPLIGRILLVDSARAAYQEIELRGSADRPAPLTAEQLRDACTLTPTTPEIDVHTMAHLLELRSAGRADFTLLDVREDDEWNISHIPGALHIPLGTVVDDPREAARQCGEGSIYVYCLAGVRSVKAAEALASVGAPAVSVTGGIRAWWDQIDPAMARY